MENIRKVALLVIFQLIVLVGQSQIIKTFSGGQTGEINSIVFSPDGKYIASSEGSLLDKQTQKLATNETIRIWDVQTGVLVKLFSTAAKVGHISFSRDSKNLIAICSSQKTDPKSRVYDSIKVWDIATKRIVENNVWRISNERRIAPGVNSNYSSDGKYYVSGGYNLFWVYNAESEKLVKTYNLPDPAECCGSQKVSAITFSPSDRFLAGFLEDNRIAIWKFLGGKIELYKILPTPNYFFSSNGLSFSPDEKYIINSSQGIVFLWDIQQGSLVGTLAGDSFQSGASTFSGDGNYIASSGQNSIKLWDFRKLLEFDPKQPPILSIKQNSISFSESPDDNTILNADEHAVVKFTIQNTGRSAAKLLQIKSSIVGESKGISIEAGGIPVIGPGKEAVVSVSVNSDLELETGHVKLRLIVAEPHGLDAQPIEINFETNSFKPARLVVTDALFSSESGGELKHNYPASLQILIQNLGTGVSKNSRAKIIFPKDVLNLGDSTYTIGSQGSLHPGKATKIQIPFIVTSRYMGQEIPIKITLSDANRPHGNVKILTAKINQKLSAAKLDVISEYSKETSAITAYLHSDVDREIPVNPKQFANRFALVIGNEDYQKFQMGLESDQNVAYARNDASIFKEYLIKTLGFPEKQVFLLTDVTGAQMNRQLQRITELVKLNPESELVFYYAGHGLPDFETREGYLVPVDVTATNLTDGISLKELYAKLATSKASKILVFLDACFSGGGRGENGLLAARTVKVKPKGEIIEGNIVAFTATSGEGVSLPLEGENHGLFTYYLLRKLKDSKGDLTLEQLKIYLESELPRASLIENGIKQTPQVLVAPDLDEKWLKWEL